MAYSGSRIVGKNMLCLVSNSTFLYVLIACTVEPRNADSLKYGHLDKQDTISRSQKTYVDNALVTPLNCVHLDIP